MPYINVNLSQKVSSEEKVSLKAGIAKTIGESLGKSESMLMIDIEDEKTIFFRGEQPPKCAFVEVRVYGSYPKEEKAAYTREMFTLFGDLLGIEKNNMFINILEFDSWGTNGNLK